MKTSTETSTYRPSLDLLLRKAGLEGPAAEASWETEQEEIRAERVQEESR